MASKRKRSEDFFYYTIEDDAEISDESDTETNPTKKSKSGQEEPEIDPDFEFFDGGDDFEDDYVTSSNLELTGAQTTVDLNEIIRKRREKREKKEKDGESDSEGDFEGFGDDAEDDEEEDDKEDDDAEEVDTEGLVDLDDGDDEVLADDGFGMGADSEDDEDEKNSDENDDDDESVASDDSVATPTDHPDDRGDEDDDDESVSSDEEEDAEEAARQKAFFADGEKDKAEAAKAKKGGKNGAKSSGSGTTSFMDMRLFSRPILRGLSAAGFEIPTEIQAKTIPFGMRGKDIVGQAVTGSGKTAAFLLPILERHLYRPTKVPTTRVVILTPTRELAMQCHEMAVKLASFTNITMALTVGGTSFKSSEANLRSRPDIVIGTPGRFIDHMRNSPGFAVDRVEILVLDEADRMLQDGFADELNEIVKTLPRGRQTMLFSATMGASVDSLIRVGLNKPVRIRAGEDDSGSSKKKSLPGTAATLTQEFVRLRPSREESRMGTLVQLCTTLYQRQVIIFFREKRYIHEARIVFGLLGLSCVELHGDIKQAERTEALESFRQGKVRFLLASDLASRGLDIQGVQTVINYEVPKTVEDYIHRIGRTARAGRRGVSVTFVTEKDRKFVKTAVKTLGKDSGKHRNVKRSVDRAAADAWQAKIDGMEDDIKEILQEEKQARILAYAEMEATKGANLLLHHDEIMSRPKRTWFESAHEKEVKKEREKKEREREANGGEKPSSVEKLREKMKRRWPNGQLSNKDRKKLDLKQERLEGMGGKKMKQEKKAFTETVGRGKPGKPGKGGKGKSGGKPKGKSGKR